MTNTIFTDIGYLGSLRAEAAATPSKAVEEVASQFEALFIQQMMKSMRVYWSRSLVRSRESARRQLFLNRRLRLRKKRFECSHSRVA